MEKGLNVGARVDAERPAGGLGNNLSGEEDGTHFGHLSRGYYDHLNMGVSQWSM